ncbi:MAG: hypothetical protein WAT93_00835 [Pontixanthobacter sp.]
MKFQMCLFALLLAASACSSPPPNDRKAVEDLKTVGAQTKVANPVVPANSATDSPSKTAHSKPDIVPVMVGGDDARDACDTYASVMQLNAKGDGFLSVRASPSASGAELDRLKSEHPMLVCNVSDDEQWAGIVYPIEPKGDPSTCGLSIVFEGPAREYKGPCKAGWVSLRYVQMSAG